MATIPKEAAMQKALRASSLVPPGFAVMGTENEDGKTVIVVRSTARASPCPSCGAGSRKIHSHYQRQIGDLPIAGRSVHLVAFVRRFRCRAARCAQGIFAERFFGRRSTGQHRAHQQRRLDRLTIMDRFQPLGLLETDRRLFRPRIDGVIDHARGRAQPQVVPQILLHDRCSQ